MENKWVKIYYELIETLKKQGRPLGVFKSLNIKSHYVNEMVGQCGWKYARHHIDEIKISGAILKDMPEYQTGQAIIVDLMEHLLLHYIIVMANTTEPNHGMLVYLQYCDDPLATWEKYAIAGCKKFAIEFDENWTKNLTFRPFGSLH
ncbi:MAG: hypothetical protein FWD52_05720 [Candidatus Bathyarchaeota archaeon]|nr:hypothetical protein [Candidatus Termiticorpusculum sp.]